MSQRAYVEILSTWEVFLLRSYVFVLNLTESLLKSVKIALKKIVKSILRNRKTINSSKNSFGKKWHCKEWFAHAIACTARADDNNNNTHLFPLLSVNKFKRFLLHLRYNYMVNASSCTGDSALGRRLGTIAKLIRTRGIVYWRHKRA